MFSAARIERLLFVIIALLLLFLSFVLYYRIKELDAAYNLISHTIKVQLNLERTYSYTKEAETAERGFLLTKDSAFIPSYYNSKNKVDSVAKKLNDLISDNQKQQVNLNTLSYLISHRFKRMDFLLLNYDSLANNSRQDFNLTLLHGRSMMESIREHVNTMIAEEERLLGDREQMKEKYLSLTPKDVLVLALFALFVLLFSFYRINHQLKIKAHYAKLLTGKNEELLAKNIELEKTNEELSSFNYITSHDLREPLRKIKTFNSIVMKDPGLSNESRNNINRIQKITSHMQSLLDDLLVYSTISNEERKMELIDLNDLMQEVNINLADLINESGAQISFAGLPNIKGIPFQMEHLFENLIDNAVKYKKPDVAPVVSITAEKISKEELPANTYSTYKSFFRINVTDNGTGFEQRYADKIFELFQRLHEKTENSGTGIGLAICRKVVHNHYGFITVDSEVNKGTQFQIYLPDLLREPMVE